MATKPGAAYGDLLQSVLADSHIHSLCMFGDIDAHCFVLYIYMHTHTHIYIHTHTHTHIYTYYRPEDIVASCFGFLTQPH